MKTLCFCSVIGASCSAMVENMQQTSKILSCGSILKCVMFSLKVFGSLGALDIQVFWKNASLLLLCLHRKSQSWILQLVYVYIRALIPSFPCTWSKMYSDMASLGIVNFKLLATGQFAISKNVLFFLAFSVCRKNEKKNEKKLWFKA